MIPFRSSIGSNFGVLKTSRLLRWTKVLAGFATVQVVVQLMNAATGLVLIRSLAKTDYALLTIFNSMQAGLNLLTDVGVGIGLNSIGGRVWRDPDRLSQLVAAGLRMRHRLTWVAAAVMVPLTLLLLLRNTTSWPVALVLVALGLLIPGPMAATGVLGCVTRLHSRFRELQQVDLLGAMTRLSLSAGLVLLWPNSITAALAILAALFAQKWLVSQQVDSIISRQVEPHSDDIRELGTLIKSQALFFGFYCFQGQIGTWLISYFGRVESVADLGALARLGIVFAVVGNILNQVACPAFARCESRQQLVVAIRRVLLVYIGFASVLLAGSYLFTSNILWILGPNYAHLESELRLMMVSLVLGGLLAVVWSLNTARGWLNQTWLIVPATLAVQAVSVALLNLSSVGDMIILGMVTSLPNLFVSVAMALRGFRSM